MTGTRTQTENDVEQGLSPFKTNKTEKILAEERKLTKEEASFLHDGSKRSVTQLPGLSQEINDQIAKALAEERQLTKEEASNLVRREQYNFKMEEGPDVDIDAVKKSDVIYSADSTLTWKDIAFDVVVRDETTHQKKTVTILKPTSGFLMPATLTAIMGPSGCGKSTLLDILARKKTKGWTGKVCLNGHDRDEMFGRVTSYVPQADIMPAHALVKEMVMFNAALRRPRPKIVDKKRMNMFADLMLNSLGLGHVKDSKIGSDQVRGISGGQRRRVTLARGIASGANILFCDEPTSGLSSTDAEICIRQLKILTRKFGTSMLVVIHQPKAEVAALFDNLILLTSQPGRVVYNGPMKDALAHYAAVGHPVPEHVNPADYFLDLVSPNYKHHQSEKFVNFYNEKVAPGVTATVEEQLANPGLAAQEIVYKNYEKAQKLFGPLDATLKGQFAAPFSKQLAIIFRRQLTLRFRDKFGLVREYVIRVAQAIIIGIAFFDVASKGANSQLSFVFLVLQMAAIGLMQQMPVQIDQRAVMKMDLSESLYRVEAYIISNFIIDTIINVSSNIIYVVICYLFANLEFSTFADFYLYNLLAMFVFDAYCLMVAAIANDAGDAQLKMMPGMIIFLLYNGFFVTKSDAEDWIAWLLYLSPLYYAINGIAVNTLNDGVSSNSAGYLQSGQYVIDTYGFEQLPYGIPVLIAMAVFYRVMQALALKHMHNLAH